MVYTRALARPTSQQSPDARGGPTLAPGCRQYVNGLTTSPLSIHPRRKVMAVIGVPVELCDAYPAPASTVLLRPPYKPDRPGGRPPVEPVPPADDLPRRQEP